MRDGGKRAPAPSATLSDEGTRAILDGLSDAVAIFDREWRIAYLNRAAKSLIEPGAATIAAELVEGFPDSLLGLDLWETFPALAESPFRATYEEAMSSGEPRQLIERIEPTDRWYEARALPQAGHLVVVYRDVTESQRAERDLRDYVDGIAEAERIVQFGVWRWDIETGRVRWSDELHRIYGLRPGQFEGTIEGFLGRIVPEDRERIREVIASSLESKRPFAFEERIVHEDGGERTLLSQGRVIVGDDGEPRRLVGVCHDVTDRVRAERELGASERRMRAIIDNTPSVITVRDLDGRFLMSNAEFERVTGVSAEEAVGRRAEELLPTEIVAAQAEEDQRAASEGERVYGETVATIRGEARNYVTVTFPLPDSKGSPAELCTIATDVTERRERESERRKRIDATERILAALEEERMIAYAQPIVDLRTDTHHSHELLARMRAPGERMAIFGPESFLPAAERFELVQAIDTWMLRQALMLPNTLRCQVNISAVTIGDPTARAQILALLRDDPERARNLVFELTETASVEQLDSARTFAAEVTEAGASLALDDFGVGFGSFSYLRALPLTYIKIDSSFVAGLNHSAHDRRLVRGVLGIAREFGLTTVAEGIEDDETLERVRELGVDLGQGHLLGRPAPLLARAWKT